MRGTLGNLESVYPAKEGGQPLYYVTGSLDV